MHQQSQAGMCKTRFETEIHPRRKLRMQSSSQAGETSSTQPLKSRIRGNPGTQQRRHRGKSDQGRP